MNIVGGVVSIEAAAPTDAAAEEQRGEAADAATEEQGGEAAGPTADDPSAAADENSRLRDAGNKVIKNLDDYRLIGAEAGAADAADAEVARQATLAAAAIKLQARHRGRLARKAYLKKLQQGFASKVKTASRFVRNLSMEADR